MTEQHGNHIGSSFFDDFLEAEGIKAEVEAVALKRVIAWQLSQTMKKNRVRKREHGTE